MLALLLERADRHHDRRFYHVAVAKGFDGCEYSHLGTRRFRVGSVRRAAETRLVSRAQEDLDNQAAHSSSASLDNSAFILLPCW